MGPEAPHRGAALLPTGMRFHGRYEVVRCIRMGGMGAVYEAVHLETRRPCALKVMLPGVVSDPQMRARFQREASILADVHSDHVVETFDAGIEPETQTPFLVMELLRGEDLAALIEAHGALPAGDALGLLVQAALALEKLHAAGIVHRDLKPENVFLTQRDDGTPRLKLLDFGIAKAMAQRPDASNATQNIGTPRYMAPEQIHGGAPIGLQTDTYALGQLAYTMLVGEAYWEEEVMRAETLYPVLIKIGAGIEEAATARAARRRGAALPAAFDAWFARATAPHPEARFARAGDLVAGLAEALGQPLPATAARALRLGVRADGSRTSLAVAGRSAPLPARRAAHRFRVVAAAVIGAGVTLLGAAAVLRSVRSAPPPATPEAASTAQAAAPSAAAPEGPQIVPAPEAPSPSAGALPGPSVEPAPGATSAAASTQTLPPAGAGSAAPRASSDGRGPTPRPPRKGTAASPTSTSGDPLDVR